MHRNKYREAAKMGRQRHVAQIKEKIKTPEKELNNMKISNLSDAEVKWLEGYSRNLVRTSTA